MPKVGLEPTCLAAEDFESSASTIPPLGPDRGLANLKGAVNMLVGQNPTLSNKDRLRLGRAERIAILQLSRFQPDLKPFRPLGTGAMGKAVRHRHLTGVALQRVIADLLGRVDRLFEITGINGAELLFHIAAPDAGQTIRLQLDPDRDCVAFRLRHLIADLVGLAQNAKLVLHMMSNLMGHT